MGCFSWMFADTNNQIPLKMDHPGYLLLPDGAFLHESSYEGYGEFGGQDIYDLVADWNREFLAQNPNFIIKQHGSIKDDTVPGGYRPVPHKRVSDFLWYAAYADLTKSREEVEAAWKEAIKAARAADTETDIDGYSEWRGIGIAIACYDDQNAALLYPIKVCKTNHHTVLEALQEIPASQSDPDQGM